MQGLLSFLVAPKNLLQFPLIVLANVRQVFFVLLEIEVALLQFGQFHFLFLLLELESSLEKGLMVGVFQTLHFLGLLF